MSGIRVVFPILFVNALGQSFVFAVVPPLARQAGLVEWQIGAVFGVSALLWAVGAVFWGRAVDRRGSRAVAMLGIGGYATSLTAFGTVLMAGMAGRLTGLTLFIALIITRMFNGLFGSAVRPAIFAHIGRTTGPRERAPAMATAESGFSVGAVFGPALGGVLALLHPLAPFLLFGGAGIPIMLLAWWGLAEKKGQAVRRAVQRLPMRLFDRRIVATQGVFVLHGIAHAVLMQMLALLVIDRAIAGEQLAAVISGAGFAALSAGTVAGQILVVRQRLFSLWRTAQFGPAFASVSMVAISLSTHYWMLIPAMFVHGIAAASTRTATTACVSLAVRSSEQGQAQGFTASVGPIGHVIAPFMSATLYVIDPRLPFAVGACLLLVATVIVSASRSIRRAAQRDEYDK